MTKFIWGLYNVTTEIKDFGERVHSKLIKNIGLSLRDLVMRLRIKP